MTIQHFSGIAGCKVSGKLRTFQNEISEATSAPVDKGGLSWPCQSVLYFQAVQEVEGGRDEDDCGLGRDLIDISWLEAAGTSQRTRYLLVWLTTAEQSTALPLNMPGAGTEPPEICLTRSLHWDLIIIYRQSGWICASLAEIITKTSYRCYSPSVQEMIIIEMLRVAAGERNIKKVVWRNWAEISGEYWLLFGTEVSRVVCCKLTFRASVRRGSKLRCEQIIRRAEKLEIFNCPTQCSASRHNGGRNADTSRWRHWY